MRASSTLALLFLAAVPVGRTSAQAQFVETFDAAGQVLSGQSGPTNLLAAGWEFRNQSNPAGNSTWKMGTPSSLFSPQAGAGDLETDSLSTSLFGGQISHWILLPAVPGQQAGDVLTFYARAVSSSNSDTLQVRYSPSGGRNTGSSSTDVGDYSNLLLDISPMATSGWVQYTATLPGNGGLALRYFVSSACNFGCFASTVGIDTLSVGDPPPPLCNLPAMPAPGKTVTWTAAGGPYRVCSDLTIPLGGTVLIEAGATIDVDNGRTLAVDGTMLAQGTPSAPITFTGGFSLVTPPLVIHGLADLTGADVTSRLHVAHGGALLVADSTFPGGEVSTDDSTGGASQGTFVSIDRCQFTGGNGI